MSTQPPPHDIYVDYHSQLPPPSRSPNSSRPSPSQYAAPGFTSATMTLPRHTQRPYETLGSAALYGDQLSNGYRTMDHLAGSNSVSPASSNMAYGFDNANANSWAYNGNVATINGALNGASRQRSVGRRSALPMGWSDAGASMPMHNTPQTAFTPNGMNSSHLPAGLLMDQNMAASPDMRAPPPPSESDQLIPTAIVIKNIPFAVRKEQLAQIMVEMNLPQPYAFNYHFDNGVFRGLAFANFQNPEDTRAVIERMNGLDVSGRKLRVEYKKMLPEAERERIEREKRERRGQLEEQHRAPMLHQQPSLQSLNAASTTTTTRTTSNTSTIPNVDLNDPNTLNFYMELTLFKRDDSREILVFPLNISPEERRQIHSIAHFIGLEHQSVGDSEHRQLHVYKKRHSPSPPGPVAPSSSLDAHRRGLSRAATFDFATDQNRGANNYQHALHRPGPTIEYPAAAESTGLPNNLRAAKSFADLRSMSPSPSANSASGYLNTGLNAFATTNAGLSRLSDFNGGSPSLSPSPTLHLNPGASSTDPTMGLASGFGSLSLGYDSLSQARTTPGAIGSQRPSQRPSTEGSVTGSRNAPDRQPRNPEWNDQQTGFAGRNRTSGHMPRGSGTPLFSLSPPLT
ncbi:hypothetical protein TD95_004980 [Thielaviopsis punctulata]|uniref:RRM domain-containing protein n=1 Tax=Thielaviopsis punctulata TaxID=72032 RepID=A0A0F4ZIC5_9PEZI|nr:hypothetical protein TD95_004980 [Thielaviopsis punctulata]